MTKVNEIEYIQRVVRTDGVSEEEFCQYLSNKPFSDSHCGEYLMDIAQILSLLPPPPAKLLDVGVGSGWTSDIFAHRGYEVLGLDISPDMIELANKRVVKAKLWLIGASIRELLLTIRMNGTLTHWRNSPELLRRASWNQRVVDLIHHHRNAHVDVGANGGSPADFVSMAGPVNSETLRWVGTANPERLQLFSNIELRGE